MKNDRFDILRATYRESINAKHDEIRQLQAKLNLLDELEADSLKLSGAQVSTGKYAKLKLTKALFDAVQTIGGNGGVTATELRKYITANGYKPLGKNFDVAAVLALNRLKDHEKISSEKIGGKRLYMVKKQT
jgi:hypothetical protein